MEHYYSEHQESPLKVNKIKQKIKGTDFWFYTASGIFSKDKIDKGTLILAENMIIDKNSKVLDIGCGIGVLGIMSAKIFDADVVMTDINKRAVMLAKKNSELNNIKVEIHHDNLYEQIKQHDFDVILSNPPQTAGKEVCFELIIQSKKYLKDNGSLQLVARHNKGGKQLSEKMKEVFGNVKIIEKKSGYWVYLSVKSEN